MQQDERPSPDRSRYSRQSPGYYQCDALSLLVRAFPNPEISHKDGQLSPQKALFLYCFPRRCEAYPKDERFFPCKNSSQFSILEAVAQELRGVRKCSLLVLNLYC